MKTDLKQAIRFHGHLGPWLVLGILSGEIALDKLKADKYFGVRVKVWGADKKPKSCLIDGLQLSTGATYGKGNIHKFNGKKIKILFSDTKRNKSILMELRKDIIKKLNSLKGHRDSEALAQKLYKERGNGAFRIRYL